MKMCTIKPRLPKAFYIGVPKNAVTPTTSDDLVKMMAELVPCYAFVL